jgi:GntR family transcriptional regulator
MAMQEPSVDARPLYGQVRDLLIARIARGEWKPGQLLPAEPRLAAELGVSAGTVRKALDELAADRLVVRQQGRGTYVAAATPDTSLFHFFRLVDRNGRRLVPASRELARDRGPADRIEAERLAIAVGAPVLRLRRLRPIDGAPCVLERISVPEALMPGLLDAAGELPNTLYVLYEQQYGLSVRRAEELIGAITLDDPADAAVMGLPPGAPVLAIERVARTFDQRPIEWRRSLVDTTRIRYLSMLD